MSSFEGPSLQYKPAGGRGQWCSDKLTHQHNPDDVDADVDKREEEFRSFLLRLEERRTSLNQKAFALNVETDGDTIYNEAYEVVVAAVAIGRGELNWLVSRWSLVHRTWSVQQRDCSVSFAAFSK